jgi:hypothetical protein
MGCACDEKRPGKGRGVQRGSAGVTCWAIEVEVEVVVVVSKVVVVVVEVRDATKEGQT